MTTHTQKVATNRWRRDYINGFIDRCNAELRLLSKTKYREVEEGILLRIETDASQTLVNVTIHAADKSKITP